MNERDFAKLKLGQTVRILSQPEGSENEFGHVNSLPDRGKVWVSNFNMPFQGTISEFYSPEDIELVREKAHDRLHRILRRPRVELCD